MDGLDGYDEKNLMFNRLSRFKRVSTVAPLQLTERDREIIRLVHRHRFLRSHQIIALVGGSSQQILRRLKLLYHHGFLERPRSQLDYFHRAGSQHMVYGLGNKSADVLKRKLCFDEKSRAVGRIFLNHALLVSDVMVAIELACRKSGQVRLIYGEDFSLPADTREKRQPFHWKVNVNGMKLSAVPDRVFALDFNGSRAFFFLEADRGTMPATRTNLSQTSFRRKLFAYEATWTQNIHRSRFGFNRFRVFTVTTSATRAKSLVNVCSQLRSGHGLFLFADKSILSGNILSAICQTGRPDETTSLLNLKSAVPYGTALS